MLSSSINITKISSVNKRRADFFSNNGNILTGAQKKIQTDNQLMFAICLIQNAPVDYNEIYKNTNKKHIDASVKERPQTLIVP